MTLDCLVLGGGVVGKKTFGLVTASPWVSSVPLFASSEQWWRAWGI